jgi:sialidase-1
VRSAIAGPLKRQRPREKVREGAAAAALSAPRNHSRVRLKTKFRPVVEQPVVVFEAGVGYPNYRIPSLTLASDDGTLVAIAEGRTHEDPGLGGQIDLVCRRSADAGVTWADTTVIDRGGDDTISNPTTVLDRHTGRIWLFYNRWSGNLGEYDCRPGTRDNTALTRFSDDHGQSWSDPPQDITRDVRDYDRWNSTAFGPGSGIQSSDGRLLVPAYRYAERSTRSMVIFSDDHGVTWRHGEPVPGDRLCNEAQVAELSSGHILLDARPAPDGEGPPRVTALSDDGGRTWTSTSTGPVAPTIKTTLLRHAASGAILWIGPRGPGRSNLVLRVSRDDGRTYPGRPPAPRRLCRLFRREGDARRHTGRPLRGQRGAEHRVSPHHRR